MSYRGFLFLLLFSLLAQGVGPAYGEVIIDSPSNGATVSGTVTVKTYVNNAWWSKLFVDGNGLSTAATGNVSFTWNSAGVANGSHVITVNAYPSGEPANASESITVTVENGSSGGGGGSSSGGSSSTTSTSHFSTLSSSATLPSDSSCASQIGSESEMVPANDGPNNTEPTSAQLAEYAAEGYSANLYGGEWAYARVDGQYTGTTDMIYRWAACKWGIDEDVVRAQATGENWSWNQVDSGGDERTSYSQCVNGDFTSLWNYMCTDCCYQSWSNWQTKVYNNWQTWPMIHDSTAFAADYRFADQRACMDGDLAGYFAGRAANNGHSYASDIASGNLNTILWGCIGYHYSGDWYDGNSTSGAEWYISIIQNYYSTKPWKSRWPSVNWPD